MLSTQVVKKIRDGHEEMILIELQGKIEADTAQLGGLPIGELIESDIIGPDVLVLTV